MLGLKNVLYTELYHQKPLDREEIYEKLMEYKEALAPMWRTPPRCSTTP